VREPFRVVDPSRVASMEKLVKGIHKFQAGFFREKTELFERLASGQSPETLFISCSDSRVIPDLLMQTDPGDLFVLRNAGNLIPPHGAAPDSGEAATIEYAVAALGVKDIIVCGHTQCGAMQALLYPEKISQLPRIQRWLGHAEATKAIVESSYRCSSPETLWRATVEENVLVQLENLRTHPTVAAALARGSVKLHGWVFEIQTGEVFAYEPTSELFVTLNKLEMQQVVQTNIRSFPRDAGSVAVTDGRNGATNGAHHVKT
jgi:carbonic anhydrase